LNRKRTEVHNDTKRHTFRERFEISLKSPSQMDVVLEQSLFRWSEWALTSSHEVHLHEAEIDKVWWKLSLEPDREVKVSYTVVYTNIQLA